MLLIKTQEIVQYIQMKISKNVQKNKIKKNRKNKEKCKQQRRNAENVFDGASSYEGVGAGVLFVAPRDE